MISVSTLDLAFLSAGVLGFRHGFDYDHIAAISDITSMEPSRRTAMRMGFVYILGHAVTLGALGAAVILFQHALPARIDRWAERAVGATLILLGLYVLGSLLRGKDNTLPPSRAAELGSLDTKLLDYMARAGDSWALNWTAPVEDGERLVNYRTFYSVQDYLAWAKVHPTLAPGIP
jgi:cytochrome c biogenesis protein CcdA